MNHCFSLRAKLLLIAALLWTTTVAAQHSIHGPRYTGDLEADTVPADDTVLPESPDHLVLRFNSSVRLVKLTLHDAEQNFIDIGFRYDTRGDRVFIHPLPKLNESDYYRAEWGVLDSNGQLVTGRFHFAFGREAKAPSEFIDEQEYGRHIMTPDYRLQAPDTAP